MSITFIRAYNEEESFDSWKEAPSLNVSNANARMLFVNLGLEDIWDYSGRISPTDLLVAIAVSDPIDTGVPAHVVESGMGATIIEGAISPGYFEDRFSMLREIALDAHKHSVDVQWC